MKNYCLSLLFIFTLHVAFAQKPERFYLDKLDFSGFDNGWSYPRINTNYRGGPLKLSGIIYGRGVCVHAYSWVRLNLNKGSNRFVATVGIDDTMSGLGGSSVIFTVLADGKELVNTGVMKPTDPAKKIDLDVSGVKLFELIVDGVGGTHHTHFTYADAYFETIGDKPKPYLRAREKEVILTPKPGPKPKINGPTVYGLRPGSPLMYKVPATGQRPIVFSAKNLPAGLQIDPASGLLTGTLAKEGDYKITLVAANAVGTYERSFTIKCGKLIGLTPALGWNSWNCWAMEVDANKVKSAADFMVSSGLADHGWSYINIDDGWQGPVRDSITGEITTDKAKFPDMKALADYVHAKGLKFGIYSSPGTLTCGGRLGSLQHEDIDAATYAKWGVDYLKHDWCSYSGVHKKVGRYEAKLPYKVMQKALRSQKRDIIYSLCQYGMKDVWNWGHEVDANSWRTTGDIIDTWSSMRVIGFDQEHCAPFAQPGRFNDPDMLVVGQVGWGPNLHPTRLTPNEQYTHISLWALLTSPLLLGCDLSKLDEFTISLLSNDEVLDINQDALAKQAKRVKGDRSFQLFVKELEDGSKAVGLFNLSELPMPYTLKMEELNLVGNYVFRDVWRQKDLAKKGNTFSTEIPPHGVVLLKISKL